MEVSLTSTAHDIDVLFANVSFSQLGPKLKVDAFR